MPTVFVIVQPHDWKDFKEKVTLADYVFQVSSAGDLEEVVKSRNANPYAMDSLTLSEAIMTGVNAELRRFQEKKEAPPSQTGPPDHPWFTSAPSGTPEPKPPSPPG